MARRQAVATSSQPRKSKKKTLSDIVNEQFDDRRPAADGYGSDDDGGQASGQVEDYDSDDGGGSDNEFGAPAIRSKAKKNGAAASSSSKSKKEKGVLRKRGSLDQGLTSGKYAAEPVSLSAIEDRMDDIFGMLDDDDGDDDGELFIDEDDDDSEAFDETRGKKGAKLKKAEKRGRRKVDTQEDFETYLEKKNEQRPRKKIREDGSSIRPKGAVEDGGRRGANAVEDDILAQIRSLRQRQTADLSLVEGDGESEPTKTSTAASAAASPAEVLRSWVAAYQQLLHLRVKMQPLVQRAVRFPQAEAFPAYHAHVERSVENAEDLSTASPTFPELAHQLKTVTVDLLHASAATLPQHAQHHHRHNADASSSTLVEAAEHFHKTFMGSINSVIEFWGTRTQTMSKNSGLKVIGQPLLEQIRAVCVSKSRLLDRAQRNRAHVAVFGVDPASVSAADRAAQIASGDIDYEIFDDADFLKELVHRSGSTQIKDQEASIESQAAKALLESGVGSRVGLHKRTKGKELNFQPRPKLVGFMAPMPYTVGTQHEALMKSLFQ